MLLFFKMLLKKLGWLSMREEWYKIIMLFKIKRTTRMMMMRTRTILLLMMTKELRMVTMELKLQAQAQIETINLQRAQTCRIRTMTNKCSNNKAPRMRRTISRAWLINKDYSHWTRATNLFNR